MKKKVVILALSAAIAYLGYRIWEYGRSPGIPPLQAHCEKTPGCFRFVKDTPLMIGVIQDLSAGAKNFGIDQKRSLEIAVARRGGNIKGHPISLVVQDSTCSAEGGKVAADQIVHMENIIAVLGTTCSRSAVTAAKVLSDGGIALISGVNSAPALTSIGGKKGKNWHPGYFRTIYSIAEKGRGAALYAFHELRKTRAAIVHDGDIYTTGYTDLFKQEFLRLGGKLVFEGQVNKGEANMLPVLNAAARQHPDFLFTPLYEEEMKHVALQVHALKALRHVPMMAVNTAMTERFLSQVGHKAIGLLFLDSSPPSQDAEIQEFLREYIRRYGSAPLSPLYDYGLDAANLLLDTIEKVSMQLPDQSLIIDRAEFKDALYNTKNYKGITGTLSCDQFGDCGVLRFNIVRLDDSRAGIEGLQNNILYEYRLDKARQ